MSAAAAVRVEDHLGLVERIAWQHARKGLDYEDLVQEGSLGLIEAVRRYEPGSGVPFRIFASRRICGAILDALRAKSSLIHIPRTQQVALRDGEAHSDREARALRARHVLRVEDSVLGELIADPGTVPARDPCDPTLRDALDAALADLPPRQRAVLEARYPPDGGAPERFAAIAARLGCSVSRVFRLRAEAVQGLRAALCVPSPADTPHPGESPMLATNGTTLPVPADDLAPAPRPARPPYTCPDCGKVFGARGRHDCRAGGILAPAPRPAPPAPAPVLSPGILGELDAMRAVVQALDGLDAAAARRVLDWVAAHYREARP